MKRIVLALSFIMAIACPSLAQTSFYTDRALQQVNVTGTPTPLTAAIPYAFVRVCNLPLTQQQPCLPLATITDAFGGQLSNSIGANFGQLSTDATGRFTFGCTTANNYQLQVQQSASNTPALNYPITCPGASSNPTFQYSNIIGFPAPCAANQFVTQVALTLGCTQPSAATLTNGTTGSGAVVLQGSPVITTPLFNTSFGFNTTNQITISPTNPSVARTYTIPDFGSNDTFTGIAATQTLTNKTLTSPIINGTPTGTGLQGTDSKLLTSGTVSGTSAFLCTDVNGGATTSGCPFTTIKTATAAGCTTGTTNGATCTTTVNWATNFPDTNYKVTCQGTGTITGYPFNIGLSKAVGSVTVTISNGASAQAVASSDANIECIGVE